MVDVRHVTVLGREGLEPELLRYDLRSHRVPCNFHREVDFMDEGELLFTSEVK